MHRAHLADLVQDGLEDRPLALGAGGEVLVERHGRRTLVRLLGPGEVPLARRTYPGRHADVLVLVLVLALTHGLVAPGPVGLAQLVLLQLAGGRTVEHGAHLHTRRRLEMSQ